MLDHLFKTNKMTMLFLHNVSRTVSWWASVLSVHYNRPGFSFVSANMKDSYFIKTYSGTNATLKKVPFWLWRTNLEMFSVTLGDCKVNLALQKDYKKHEIECPS